MQHRTMVRAALTAVAAVGLALGLALAVVPAASAATPGFTSFQTPVKGGLLLNALHWGGTGSKAATLAHGGVVNDPISVWDPAQASVASDFVVVPVNFPASETGTGQDATCAASGGCFLIEYAPGDHLSGLCVSTVTDVKGAFARLRVCASSNQGNVAVPATLTTPAFAAFNQWQDFANTGGGDQLSQLEAVLEPVPGPFVLNDAAFGGNGSQVISWPSISGFGAENQLWEQVPAAS